MPSQPMRTTASRPHARSRTSRSAGCARIPISSPPRSSSRRPPRWRTSRSAASTRAVGDAIVAAADEVLAGGLRDQFVVDVYQAGAGTSHNMNANEVLANRAAELLGGARGEYTRVHPNDHVNMGQSTNDVFPTATRLALLMGMTPLVAGAQALAARAGRQGRRLSRHREGRPHASAGRRADDARPGVSRLRRRACGAAPTTCCARRSSCTS